MKIHEQTVVRRTFQSEVQADVSTNDPDLAEVIAWADQHPVAWEIVTRKRSKAFGVGSCVYIGWAQRSMAPEAILQRLRTFMDLLSEGPNGHPRNSIFRWRARFTFEHYREKGFTGAFFQQHDERYPRSCMMMDYTPEAIEEVIDRFCSWMDPYYHVARITVGERTVREFQTASAK